MTIRSERRRPGMSLTPDGQSVTEFLLDIPMHSVKAILLTVLARHDEAVEPCDCYVGHDGKAEFDMFSRTLAAAQQWARYTAEKTQAEVARGRGTFRPNEMGQLRNTIAMLLDRIGVLDDDPPDGGVFFEFPEERDEGSPE